MRYHREDWSLIQVLGIYAAYFKDCHYVIVKVHGTLVPPASQFHEQSNVNKESQYGMDRKGLEATRQSRVGATL